MLGTGKLLSFSFRALVLLILLPLLWLTVADRYNDALVVSAQILLPSDISLDTLGSKIIVDQSGISSSVSIEGYTLHYGLILLAVLVLAAVGIGIVPRIGWLLGLGIGSLGRDGAADGRTAPAGLRHPPLRTGRATFTASGSPSDGLDWCVGNIGFSAILVGFIHPASGVVRFVPLPSDCPPSPCGRLSRPRTTTRALPHVRRWPKAGLLRCRRAGRASQVRPGCIFMPS